MTSLVLWTLLASSPCPALPPPLLSETGLYGDPTVRSYSPQYPLWSDGAVKRRWIALPPGTTIDATDEAAWEFPVGTRLWKEFAFDGRKVETRLLCRTAEDRWVYAAYVWNEQQTEATLAPEGGVPRAAAIGPGKSHSVPSLADCSACHEAGVGPVLGFDALQLSDDRDPNAPHAEPLEAGMVTDRTLVEEGWLSPRRGDLLERPPVIRASSPLERSVLGYLATNCGTCHNESGPLAGLGLSLAHPAGTAGAERMLLGTRDVAGLYAIPGLAPGETRRLAPGDPDRSSLVHRMASRRPASQMPPLGTVLPDTEAVELIRSWIAAVP